jgi:hypothetical protein
MCGFPYDIDFFRGCVTLNQIKKMLIVGLIHVHRFSHLFLQEENLGRMVLLIQDR